MAWHEGQSTSGPGKFKTTEIPPATPEVGRSLRKLSKFISACPKAHEVDKDEKKYKEEVCGHSCHGVGSEFNCLYSVQWNLCIISHVYYERSFLIILHNVWNTGPGKAAGVKMLHPHALKHFWATRPYGQV